MWERVGEWWGCLEHVSVLEAERHELLSDWPRGVLLVVPGEHLCNTCVCPSTPMFRLPQKRMKVKEDELGVPVDCTQQQHIIIAKLNILPFDMKQYKMIRT